MTSHRFPGPRSGFPLASRLQLFAEEGELGADLVRIPPEAWGEQQSALGAIDEKAGWSTVSLRAVHGNAEDRSPGLPGHGPYSDTPLLRELPAFASLLRSLPFPTASIRLSALHPGGKIAPHRGLLGFHTGKVRLHLPVVTNEAAHLTVGGVRFQWPPGELWYADFGEVHSVENLGAETRVHMIVDALVTPELLSLFPEPARGAMSKAISSDGSAVVMYQPASDITDSCIRRCASRILCLGGVDGMRAHEALGQMFASDAFGEGSEVTFNVADGALAIDCDGQRIGRLEYLSGWVFRPLAGLPCDRIEFIFEQRGGMPARVQLETVQDGRPVTILLEEVHPQSAGPEEAS